jgi:RNA polymerase sigma-70 factor (ECF subfamily)
MVQLQPGAVNQLLEQRKAVYEANRRRVYSYAFWMTDSEPLAEFLCEQTFLRAFSLHEAPGGEQIDQALLRELNKQAGIQLGPLELSCEMAMQVSGIRRSARRIELEQALLQLPYTERMIFCMHDGDGYDHARIARTLEISESDSRHGLHQARLRIRELVSKMIEAEAA